MFNVRALTDAAGDVVERYRYDPYGKTKTFDGVWAAEQSTSRVANPFGYTGREWEAVWADRTGAPVAGLSKLYHYRARGYSAEQGRFLQRDPLGYVDGPSMYEYARGSAANGTDPFGTELLADSQAAATCWAARHPASEPYRIERLPTGRHVIWRRDWSDRYQSLSEGGYGDRIKDSSWPTYLSNEVGASDIRLGRQYSSLNDWWHHEVVSGAANGISSVDETSLSGPEFQQLYGGRIVISVHSSASARLQRVNGIRQMPNAFTSARGHAWIGIEHKVTGRYFTFGAWANGKENKGGSSAGYGGRMHAKGFLFMNLERVFPEYSRGHASGHADFSRYRTLSGAQFQTTLDHLDYYAYTRPWQYRNGLGNCVTFAAYMWWHATGIDLLPAATEGMHGPHTPWLLGDAIYDS